MEGWLKDKVSIKKITLDILKTLNLFNKYNYYNIAAELLADKNNIAFSGIDVVKFGKDINKILYRETLSNISVLSQYERAVMIFKQYYQYEEVEGYYRVKKELIPEEAFLRITCKCNCSQSLGYKLIYSDCHV